MKIRRAIYAHSSLITMHYANGYFLKWYDLNTLVTDRLELQARADKIEEITKESCITQFRERHNTIIRSSKKVRGTRSLKRGKVADTTARKLATLLDQQCAIGLVHGDIHPKNIIVDQNDNPVLIDYELDLIQLTPRGKILMVTPPWIDSNDRSTNSVTINTDILCFYHLLYDKPKAFYQSNEWSCILTALKREHKPFQSIYNLKFSADQSIYIDR